jgi:hypothetical protein
MKLTLGLAAGLVVLVSMTAPQASRAATFNVNCDTPSSKLPTINSALKWLDGLVGNFGPNTINVRGNCNENISISGKENLTLVAQDGASITDASAGSQPVIYVEKTTNFALNGFSVRGGGGVFNAGIVCIWSSTCYLSENNVQNPGHLAINTAFGSFLSLNHDTLEQSQLGLYVHSSKVEMVSTTIQNNVGFGIYALKNSFVAVVLGSSVDHNAGGMLVVDHSAAEVSSASISGNTNNGLVLQSQSEVNFSTVPGKPIATIAGNGNHGIVVDDLSFANFINAASTAVAGNAGQPDIVCQGHFSAISRNAAITGSTNCPP